MLPSEELIPLLLPVELCTPPVPEDRVVLYKEIRIEENGICFSQGIFKNLLLEDTLYLISFFHRVSHVFLTWMLCPNRGERKNFDRIRVETSHPFLSVALFCSVFLPMSSLRNCW